MQYRNLGKWGVKVSAVSLGSWLTYGGTVEEDTARRCVEHAYDLGVNLFDTANVYALGRSEEVVGKALAPYRRDSYVLATKVFFRMGEGPNDGGLSRKHIFEQAHHSLRRLGVDYVDLYQCHRYDDTTPLEETCRAMDDLIRQGKVLYWGVSEWSAEQILAADELCRSYGWAPPVSNQPQYNALWRRIEHGVLQACEQVGMGNVVWSPLAMGVLTGKYRSADDLPADSRAASDALHFMAGYLQPAVIEAVNDLRAVARDAECSLAQLALAWCLRQPLVSSVIVGASRPQQLDETLRAADLELDSDVFQAVDLVLADVQLGLEAVAAD